MKKAIGETQTLVHSVCVSPSQTFSPHHRLPSRGAGQPISWRWSLPSPTDQVWWRSMHAMSIYRDNRPTNTQRPPTRCTQTITIHCAVKLSTQSNNKAVNYFWPAGASIRRMLLVNVGWYVWDAAVIRICYYARIVGRWLVCRSMFANAVLIG